MDIHVVFMDFFFCLIAQGRPRISDLASAMYGKTVCIRIGSQTIEAFEMNGLVGHYSGPIA